MGTSADADVRQSLDSPPGVQMRVFDDVLASESGKGCNARRLKL